jgi:hypothetical protein
MDSVKQTASDLLASAGKLSPSTWAKVATVGLAGYVVYEQFSFHSKRSYSLPGSLHCSPTQVVRFVFTMQQDRRQ